MFNLQVMRGAEGRSIKYKCVRNGERNTVRSVVEREIFNPYPTNVENRVSS